MKLGQKMVDGIFLERPNRYLARVRIDGEEVPAHIPDPGRLPGLMIPGRKIRLIYNPGPHRKTQYTLALVCHGRIWVGVYPSLANGLVEEALEKNKIEHFSGYAKATREVKMGASRFDFKLDFPAGPAYVEVKCVSFVEQGVGRFPDAPTLRGQKHLKELAELRGEGCRAAVVFVSPRSDTRSITSNDAVDPAFGECLRAAKKAGVELYGYNCRVTASSLSINREVEVFL